MTDATPTSRHLFATLLLMAAPLATNLAADPAPARTVPAKKIVLIAGKKSHGPVGNGIHDYPWSVRLLKVMLDNSNVKDQVRVEFHLDGWPEDQRSLEDADTIMVISDGRDGDKYEEAPHFQTDERATFISQQMARGCGFATLHFSTFAPDKYAEQILNWSGGYFDWETDGKREWYSAIRTAEANVELASPEHPISSGLKSFPMKEEFYYNIRFQPHDKRLQPIWTVPALEGREPDGDVVAWAREREDGGRGFGTTTGHFYENWKHDNFRKLILNALVWTAGLDVPDGGVAARYYSHDEITQALRGVSGTQRAAVDDRPIKVLIMTGWQYPGHKWQDTTPVLREALLRDPRMQVDVSENIEDFATDKLAPYDLLVLNYCNWMRPGLSDAAKSGFVKYLQAGGGLVLIHFANGAFHFSLPEAGESDWPEFRKICRRVWNHHGKSGHDAYGKFIVEIANPDHEISRGMEPFETIDELYFRQEGDEPIDVVAHARSKVTGQFEPLAFVYQYGDARVFQTVLGHAAESIRVAGASELVRRAAAWVAGRAQVAAKPVDESAPRPVQEADAPPSLGEGRFAKAFDARGGGVSTDGRAEYRMPPITVECWAKLLSKQGFNILVANESKASGTHWEMFSFAGTGHYTVYLPGMTPDHIRSTIDICDGQWHALGMIYEPDRMRLFVDGQQVADQPLESKAKPTVPGPLAFGSLATGELGCDGLIDDLRISAGVRTIAAAPQAPLPLDEHTLGLWRFDAIAAGNSFADESRFAAAAVSVKKK